MTSDVGASGTEAASAVTPFPEPTEQDIRRLVMIREETRFEINLLNERVGGLISAEAFLTIAYTAAMSNTSPQWGLMFSRLVAPALAVLGLLLALLAWPGVAASFRIILAWNARQLQVMEDSTALMNSMWRPDVPGKRGQHADPDQRLTMLFARAVPGVFVVAWLVLVTVALVLTRR